MGELYPNATRCCFWGVFRVNIYEKMNELFNPKLTPTAQKLRRNMTKEERHLWYDFLRTLPVPVKRQKVLGRYIVDFYVPCAKLVIEIDGTQHFEVEGELKDKTRDEFLNEHGLTVLRYSNYDVNVNFDVVCQDIWNYLEPWLP